jgi:hypothetical protein
MSRAGWTVWTLTCLLLWSPAARAADNRDPLGQARLLYNQGQYQAAVAAADRARGAPMLADSADLIAARAYLEHFRESGDAADLSNGRDRLRRLNTQRFTSRERIEFVIGLGEALFFDNAFGAAADVFDSVLQNPDGVSGDARERVLDWWASALDREAWPRPDIERQGVYQRIRNTMRQELAARPSSATAAYWLAAGARAQGELQEAWDAVSAAWVRASLASDRGVALRADLDRLMLLAIIPERARATGQPPEALRADWEMFKEKWRDGQ